MRKFLVLAMAALALLAGFVLPTEARGTAAPFCGIQWGSLPKQDLHYTTANITNLRAGRHASSIASWSTSGRAARAGRVPMPTATRCAT